MKAWSIVALLLFALAFGLWGWMTQGRAPVPMQAAGGASEAGEPVGAATGGRVSERDGAASRERRAVPSDAVATFGRLMVVVVRDSGIRVPGVPVELFAADGRNVRATRRRLVSDARGELLVADLAAGPWRVRIGQEVDQVVRVVGNDTTHLQLTVPLSSAVTVKVVDEAGASVAGADVLLWLADRYYDAPCWQAGVVVGKSDGRGELVVDGISQRFGNGSWVQARVAGLGASLARMVPVVASSTNVAASAVLLEPVVLTVSRRHAEATVAVLGMDGEPLADASVALRAVDAPTSKVVGSTRATPYVARDGLTDRRGIVRFAPLAAGRWQVLVSAVGHGMSVDGFSVVGEAPTDVRVTLGPPAAIVGRVTDSSGRALAAAEVAVRTLGEKFRATTGDDGAFAFGGLAAGLLDWSVWCEGYVSRSGSLDVSLAGPVRLDVVLQPLATLAGRLVDENGAVLVGWLVECTAQLPGYVTDRRQTRTKAEGAFALQVRPGQSYKLHVVPTDSQRAIRPPACQAVTAADSPLEVVVASSLLPSAFVSLRLVNQAHRPALAGLTAVHRLKPGGVPAMAARDNSSGRLRLGPMLPGKCVLQLTRSDGFEFRLPEVELAAGSERRLGDVAWPQHGTLIVDIERLPGIHDGDVSAELRGAFGGRHMVIDKQSLRGSVAVLPGSWQVIVFGGGFRSERVMFDVVAGQESRQQVVLRPAVRVPLRVIKPAGEDSIVGKIVLSNGALLFDFEIVKGQKHDDWAPQLSVGEYRATGIGASGRNYTAAFRVTSLKATSERRQIILK